MASKNTMLVLGTVVILIGVILCGTTVTTNNNLETTDQAVIIDNTASDSYSTSVSENNLVFKTTGATASSYSTIEDGKTWLLVDGDTSTRLTVAFEMDGDYYYYAYTKAPDYSFGYAGVVTAEELQSMTSGWIQFDTLEQCKQYIVECL